MQLVSGGWDLKRASSISFKERPKQLDQLSQFARKNGKLITFKIKVINFRACFHVLMFEQIYK